MFGRRRILPLIVAACGLGVLAACGSTAQQTSAAPAAASSTTGVPAPAAVTPSAVTGPGSTMTEASAPAPEVSASPAAAPVTSGAYIEYAAYAQNPAAATGRVVLFFHATWCPICQEVDRSLTAAPVPAGLTVVKVDFDNSDALRQRYGVTIQHTFVQVDTSGRQLKKWSTGTLADQILAKTV